MHAVQMEEGLHALQRLGPRHGHGRHRRWPHIFIAAAAAAATAATSCPRATAAHWPSTRDRGPSGRLQRRRRRRRGCPAAAAAATTGGRVRLKATDYTYMERRERSADRQLPYINIKNSIIKANSKKRNDETRPMIYAQILILNYFVVLV